MIAEHALKKADGILHLKDLLQTGLYTVISDTSFRQKNKDKVKK